MSNRDSATAATEILKLAVYSELQPQWKPLQQKIVDRYREMFLPLSTHRVYERSGYDNAPTVSTTSMDCQSTGMTALTVCSHVLNNMTLKNISYQMIMNYTVFKLPAFTVSQDNSTYNTFCKEDEVAGYWRESLEAFYYYYPENTTIMNKLYISAFNSQHQWNGRADGPAGKGSIRLLHTILLTV